MELDGLTMEEKCQNLMNVVVESRKQYGKRCIEYEKKSSLIETKILNLQVETMSNSRFRSKNVIPSISVEDMCKDTEEFAKEILDRKKRIELLKKKVNDTQNIVLQLKNDTVGRKVKQRSTVQAMLELAKAKQRQEK